MAVRLCWYKATFVRAVIQSYSTVMNRSMVQRQSVGDFSGREFIFTKYPVTARKLTHRLPGTMRKDVLLHPVSE